MTESSAPEPRQLVLWGRCLIAAEPIAGAGRGESRFGLAEILIAFNLTETSRERTPRRPDCDAQRVNCSPDHPCTPANAVAGPITAHCSSPHGNVKARGLGLVAGPTSWIGGLRGTSLWLNLETEQLSTKGIGLGGRQRRGKQLEAWETNAFLDIPRLSSYGDKQGLQSSPRSPANHPTPPHKSHPLCRHRPGRTILKVSSGSRTE